MKKTVLGFSQLSDDLIDQLQQQFNLIQIEPKKGNIEQQFAELLPQAEGLIGAGRQLDERLLKYAQKLKVISTISVGYDNYNVDYLTSKGILLTNTPDVLTETTADLGFTLLMSAARRVAELDQWTKQGHWQKTVQPSHYGMDVHGKTLGIIGLGNIGAAIARRGHFGFNMPILYSGQSQKPALEQELNAKFCSLNALLQQSDFVVVATALNEHTRHLLSTPQFALMKSSAILVNIARGGLIDEQALIAALQNKQIWAAGLDVYEQEPLKESPLFNLAQVVTLPHVGSATHDTRQAMNDLAFENLRRALQGTEPKYMVNSSVWPTIATE